MKQPLTQTAAAAELGLSDETAQKLAAYIELLAKWTQRINLVAPSTMGDPWRRHVLDSGQLFRLLPDSKAGLVDLGSGAGLPGLVLAIMGAGPVHLVESDQRKCAFLREAARVTEAPVTIHAKRAEDVAGIAVPVVTARALAPLNVLLAMAARFLEPGGSCLFLKGARYADELTEAGKSWHMGVSEYSSQSDPDGVVLHLRQPAAHSG